MTKIIHFEISHNTDNCKRGPLKFFDNHSDAKFLKNEGEPIGVFEKFSKKTRIFKSHSAEKSERDPLGFFNIRSVAKYQNKLKGGPFEDIKNFSKKKSHKAEKRDESHIAEKVRTFCFGILVKKLAHTHGFEHEPSGLKSKHLTTRPRTPELCDLRAETRVVARKKSTRKFP